MQLPPTGESERAEKRIGILGPTCVDRRQWATLVEN